MTTKSPEKSKTAKTSWWERLMETSEDAEAGSNFLKKLLWGGAILCVIVAGWLFFQKSSHSKAEANAQILAHALALLPDQAPPEFEGLLPHPRFPQISLSRYHYLVTSMQNNQRSRLWGALSDQENAKKYVGEAESAIEELNDNASRFQGSDDEWLFKNALQQLHWFAGINTIETAARKAHLQKQLEILADMIPTFKNHVVLGLHPDPAKPDKNVMELWEDAAKAELKFLDTHKGPPTLEPDPGLKVTLTLENDGQVAFVLYSRVAPKTVANFIANIRDGVYDGTAVYGVDKARGALLMGDPFTRLAPDRPFIWDKADSGYAVPGELNPLLKPKKGRLFMARKGAASHPFHFGILTKDPDNPAFSETVFGEVTEGLDLLIPWLDTEVHDEVGLTNTFLPRVRLGIKSVVVEGNIAYPGDDSWKPHVKIPEVPEATPAEEKFMEAIKPSEEEPKKEGDAKEGDSENDAPAPKKDG